MASLVIAEHDNASLKDATHKTVTAAAQLSNPVHVLVAGENCAGVAQAAAKIAGVEKVLLADAPAYARQLAEPMEALIVSLAGPYDAILAPATTAGKNFLPRVAAITGLTEADVVALGRTPVTLSDGTVIRFAGRIASTIRLERR